MEALAQFQSGVVKSAADYIENLQVSGRLAFTTEDIVRALGKSVPAVRAQLRRLKEKGRIADPFRGFHVVVPPKYRRLGCLPADQFIPQLMAHLGEPYYVALLSAAVYYGAAHQKPQVLQVMLSKARRGLECGGVRVNFVTRRDMGDTPVVERNTPAGVIHVASPAATALELVGYPERCGYLDNVATVLAELAESIDGNELEAEAQRVPVAWTQRLGYLLVLVEQNELADRLDGVLAARNVFVVPLVSRPKSSITNPQSLRAGRSILSCRWPLDSDPFFWVGTLAPWEGIEGAPRDSRWRVAINTDVEPDV